MRITIPSLFLLTSFLVAFSACAASPSPPSPGSPPKEPPLAPIAAAPTATPAAVDDLSAVRASGVLRIGTTADYAPFTFFNSTGQLDGFDIALIRELAKRLGVAPQINDYAFDILLDALAVGQIDAAIAAISITPVRTGQVDFTNLYYAGQDGILTSSDSPLAKIASPVDLAGLRIGVQRGTVYEQWAQGNLVLPGLIQPEQLTAYDRPADAVRDLKAGSLDAVMMDLLPARQFSGEGVRLVGRGLIPQKFAVATRQGSTLTAELNRLLAEAQADGTVANLAERYLKAEQALGELPQPSPTATLKPSPVPPTSTPVPPTPPPNQPVITKFSATPANLLLGQCTNLSWSVQAGASSVDLRRNGASVWQNAPLTGSYADCPTSTGTVLYELIALRAGGLSRAEALVTVGSNVPPGTNYPVIYGFSINPSLIEQGECTTVVWSSAFGSTVRLWRDGLQLYSSLPDNGSTSDCPPAIGQVVYLLIVSNSVGEVQTETYLEVED